VKAKQEPACAVVLNCEGLLDDVFVQGKYDRHKQIFRLCQSNQQQKTTLHLRCEFQVDAATAIMIINTLRTMTATTTMQHFRRRTFTFTRISKHQQHPFDYP